MNRKWAIYAGSIAVGIIVGLIIHEPKARPSSIICDGKEYTADLQEPGRHKVYCHTQFGEKWPYTVPVVTGICVDNEVPVVVVKGLVFPSHHLSVAHGKETGRRWHLLSDRREFWREAPSSVRYNKRYPGARWYIPETDVSTMVMKDLDCDRLGLFSGFESTAPAQPSA